MWVEANTKDVPVPGGALSEVKTQAKIEIPLRERLVAFYQEHNPDNLRQVDTIVLILLAKGLAGEKQLHKDLLAKYGASIYTETPRAPGEAELNGFYVLEVGFYIILAIIASLFAVRFLRIIVGGVAGFCMCVIDPSCKL